MNPSILTICLYLIGIISILLGDTPFARTTLHVEYADFQIQSKSILNCEINADSIRFHRYQHDRVITRADLTRYRNRLQEIIASPTIENEQLEELVLILNEISLHPMILANPRNLKAMITAKDQATGLSMTSAWRILPAT
ncbi:hypothetical protein [Collinsella sp. D33t1_170424_A12]|uniref:hypothetical protein n=1 Tax=Collinsella sp. D33t1_170424_A12 TaxID=2787135 RepID=UPI001899011C|nr:hypothetical protein [Collinsella sp. D33t1_170424_A12]